MKFHCRRRITASPTMGHPTGHSPIPHHNRVETRLIAALPRRTLTMRRTNPHVETHIYISCNDTPHRRFPNPTPQPRRDAINRVSTTTGRPRRDCKMANYVTRRGAPLHIFSLHLFHEDRRRLGIARAGTSSRPWLCPRLSVSLFHEDRRRLGIARADASSYPCLCARLSLHLYTYFYLRARETFF